MEVDRTVIPIEQLVRSMELEALKLHAAQTFEGYTFSIDLRGEWSPRQADAIEDALKGELAAAEKYSNVRLGRIDTSTPTKRRLIFILAEIH